MRSRVDAVFQALADPQRRILRETHAGRGAAPPTQHPAALPGNPQAGSKHLGTLRAAELVEPTRAGREIRYSLRPEPLGDALEWMERVDAQWDERLGALRRHLS